MATVQVSEKETSAAAIFGRVWERGLSPTVARHVVKLSFAEDDVQRMHELAEKNRQGKLTVAEEREFDNYVTVGDLLAILQSRARKMLKKATAKSNRHG